MTMLCSLSAHAETENYEGGTGDAFGLINQLRETAGMTAFSKNKQLSEAALNHALYCHDNRTGGHFESKTYSGYTGYDHIERINTVGYKSRTTGENVSSHKGVADDKKSVDGLMSAIYHRFAFLSFDFDEIGIGIKQSDDYSSFVYNMGNTLKNKQCLVPSSKKSGKYYSSVCSNKQFRISAKDFDEASFDTQKNNPAVVTWPPENSNDIPPAFFEESPDPLPGYGVSGYPVSVQFNPSVFSEVVPVITRFELIDLQTGKSLKLIKRIDEQSDQHKKFTAYEHAIFPVERLDWSRQYRAEVDYMVQGGSETKSWNFNTRDLNVPIYDVSVAQGVISESSGNTFTIYLPPKHHNDAEMSYGTRYRGLSALDVKIIDGNTLMVKATGTGDAEISFHGIKIKFKFSKK